MSLQSFIDKYNGKKVEHHSFSSNSKYQCVDLANQWIVEGLGLPAIIGTNAQDFPKKAEPHFEYIKNKLDIFPEPGDLVIFKSPDGVGHISIYVKYIHQNLFTSFDQNYPTGAPCKLVNHNYKNVLGWMRPKGESMPSDGNIEISKETFEQLVTKADKYDKFERAGYNSVEKMLNKFDELKNECKAANESRKQAEEAAEISRRELRDFVAVLADDQHLKTRQDKAEIIAVASRYGVLMGNFEDLSIRYQNEKELWGSSKAELESEIARLKAMLDYEEVLTNASLEEIIRALIKKLQNILRTK